MVGDRVRDPDHLAGLVMGLALELARLAAEHGRRAVANEVPPPLAVARVEEELQCRARRVAGCPMDWARPFAVAPPRAFAAMDQRRGAWWAERGSSWALA